MSNTIFFLLIKIFLLFKIDAYKSDNKVRYIHKRPYVEFFNCNQNNKNEFKCLNGRLIILFYVYVILLVNATILNQKAVHVFLTKLIKHIACVMMVIRGNIAKQL